MADDWLIAVDGVRQQLLDENAKVEWTPPQYGKRMDDWLRNMEDWNISRRRYYGLPLPIYPCTCGHVNVIGSRAELEARALTGIEDLQELHRPWIDAVVITCEQCGAQLRRVPEVGDVWLDAGIVPFSTLGWMNPEFIPEGYATGAAKGLTKADLPDHGYWEQWFPADWVTEMREQIRLWFYSLLFMSVVLTGRAPFRKVLTYEKLLDADGREMHGSWGNLICADEAFDRMGADVMRWLYCRQPPTQNIRFGYGPANEVQRRLLTLWNSVRFFVDYAAIEAFRPRYEDLETGVTGVALRPLDRWLLARVDQFVGEAEAAYDTYLSGDVTNGFDALLEDLSNWYIRRSRRRFYSFDEAAFRTLWTALVQALRVMSPVLPFLSERLWQELVADVVEGAPASVHLAGWPQRTDRPDDAHLLTEIAMVNVARPANRPECDVDQVAGPTALQARRSQAPGHGSATRRSHPLRDRQAAEQPGGPHRGARPDRERGPGARGAGGRRRRLAQNRQGVTDRRCRVGSATPAQRPPAAAASPRPPS